MRAQGLDDPTYLSVLHRLAEEPPRRELLRRIADALLRLLDAERVFVFRFRPGGGFRLLVARNLDGDDIVRPLQRMSHFAVREMERAGAARLVAEARQDRRYRSEDVQSGGKPPRAILILPLRVRGRIFGGVYADHRFQPFGEDGPDREDVQRWVGLCAVAAHLREQQTALRRMEKKLRSSGGTSDPPADAPLDGGPSVAPLAPRESEELHGFWSANPDVLDDLDRLRRVADTSIPVLIHGETGVGKTLLARAVHELSARSEHPFETLGCGALPETLLESELLGHARGSFTGADADHEGILARAHRGTLLFDEVGDMTPSLQTMLLRVIEDGKVRPLGGKDVLEVDVRYVSTTSSDLERLVGEGRFRRDLYFRLRGLVIELPPLRQRREDVPGLASRFLARHAGAAGVARIRPRALDRLIRYSWPGNVRELENEVRRLAALGHDEIDIEHLSPFLRQSGRARRDGAGRGDGLQLEDAVSLAERDAILAALRRSGGNKSRAAADLGITRKSLYRRLRKYRITADGASPRAGSGLS